MTTEFFKAERANVEAETERIGESALVLNELVADNVLGDPHLGPAMRTISAANGALDAALTLLRVAKGQLEQAEREEGGIEASLDHTDDIIDQSRKG